MMVVPRIWGIIVVVFFFIFLHQICSDYYILYSPEIGEHNIFTMTSIITNLCKDIVTRVYAYAISSIEIQTKENE